MTPRELREVREIAAQAARVPQLEHELAESTEYAAQLQLRNAELIAVMDKLVAENAELRHHLSPRSGPYPVDSGRYPLVEGVEV